MTTQWNKLSLEQQKAIQSKANEWLFTGTLKTKEWLEWNLPKLSYIGLNMIFGILDDEANSAVMESFQCASTTKELDKIHPRKPPSYRMRLPNGILYQPGDPVIT